jgi:hypothetical protein
LTVVKADAKFQRPAVRDQEVAGSNPVAPTYLKPYKETTYDDQANAGSCVSCRPKSLFFVVSPACLVPNGATANLIPVLVQPGGRSKRTPTASLSWLSRPFTAPKGGSADGQHGGRAPWTDPSTNQQRPKHTPDSANSDTADLTTDPDHNIYQKRAGCGRLRTRSTPAADCTASIASWSRPSLPM